MGTGDSHFLFVWRIIRIIGVAKDYQNYLGGKKSSELSGWQKRTIVSYIEHECGLSLGADGGAADKRQGQERAV